MIEAAQSNGLARLPQGRFDVADLDTTGVARLLLDSPPDAPAVQALLDTASADVLFGAAGALRLLRDSAETHVRIRKALLRKRRAVAAIESGRFRDEIVPFGESERMVEAFCAAGGKARLTIYPEAGHDSWTETYGNPELYEWLLNHRR